MIFYFIFCKTFHFSRLLGLPRSSGLSVDEVKLRLFFYQKKKNAFLSDDASLDLGSS